MWMAQRGRKTEETAQPIARVGRVTVSGNPLGVYVDGERRNLPIFSPSGYRWMPKVGDRVLVLKTDEGGCVFAGAQSGDALDGNAVRISAEGGIALEGDVTVNGEGLEQLIVRLIRANMPTE